MNHLRNLISARFVNVRKLCFRTRYRIDPHQFIFPSVQHYIFYGYASSRSCIYHCDITKFSGECPQAKTIEFRTVVKLCAPDKKKSQHSFLNLQTFKFIPYDDDELKFARDLFTPNGTEIVIFE